MDGFNSREFYGHSLTEDPKLRTTTRNYEFKYNSSDHLDRIISRVRMDREKKKGMKLLALDNGDVKFQNRLPKAERSHVMKMPTVETQIGRASSRESIVKIMSEEEIEAMLSQAIEPTKNLPALDEIKSVEDILSSKEIKQTEEVQKDEKIPQLPVEIFPNPQPQWVEIKPVQKSMASLFEVPADSFYAADSSDSEDSEDLNLSDEIPEKENRELGLYETMNTNNYFDSLSLDNIATEDFFTRNQESDFQNDGDGDEESPREIPISLNIDLNECEHLEMDRVFENVLPYVPKIQCENLESPEESEYNEYSDKEDENNYKKVQDDDSFENEDFDTQNEPEMHVRRIDSVARPIKTLSFRSVQSSPVKTSRSVKKSSKSYKEVTTPCSTRSPPIVQTEMRANIQVEDLKQEKLRIFSKMTSIQEKIIKCLDALRISLVEISLPDGEIEKKLRERNALEFSVRFSRNYLFPLGKMIEDLRLSPKEDYRSALTNEPCVKVCGIYGLLSQTVQCYQKQLRHFFTDSFPNKLDLLLNLIKDTTNLCLEKQIFDKRDTLIQSLLSRCEMFLEFVMEFSEKKKSARTEEMVMQSERRSRFKLPKTSSKWDLTMNLNNLNMYEPKLVKKKTKKTLPKKTVKTVRTDIHRGSSITKTKKLTPRDSSDHVALPIQDPVETQVRKDYNVDSVQLINDAIAEEPDSELAKTVIETLQDITKDEVHQIFGPIVHNLDSILKSSDNPQTAVESVINVLKNFQEANGKQLKIDEIVTENIIQNSNSYQKEVTKKGTHSSKGKQQQQQRFKESRQNKVAKARVTSCSGNNVKEDSTEQTERYNSRSELMDTNTICDKQSLRNIETDGDGDDDSDNDVAFAAFVSENENSLMKQKTRSEAFLLAIAAAAKKPTPVLDTNEVGGIAAADPRPSTSLNISTVKLDDVMPPPPSQAAMTSEKCLYYSTGLPVGLPRIDKFASDSHNIIGDGKQRKEDAASQRNVRDGAANAIDRDKANHEAWRKNLPTTVSSPVKNEETKSCEVEKFNYRRNALYTFVKYLQNSLPSENEKYVTENVNQITNNGDVVNKIKTQKGDATIKSTEECCLESPIQSIKQDPTVEEQQIQEHKNDIDIKAILKERNDFIERCKDDPFYTNPQFPQPWKVLSKISKVIASEIVENFENDLSFGEESYIRDFINMEIQN